MTLLKRTPLAAASRVVLTELPPLWHMKAAPPLSLGKSTVYDNPTLGVYGPRQFGPTTLTPASRAARATSSSSRLPSSVPASEKPAVYTHTTLTPLAPQSRTNCGTALLGIQHRTKSTGSGSSLMLV